MAWMECFKDSIAEFLTNGIYDHSPMVINTFADKGTCPKAFRYFNTWADEPDFFEVMEAAWNIPVQGTSMYKFVTKLKNVKMHLIAWRKSKFTQFSAQVSAAKQNMENTQRSLQINPFCPTTINEERAAVTDFANKARHEEAMKKQQSRVQWLKLGDNNTPFFHKSILERRARNKILILHDDNGNRLSTDADIANECVTYYKTMFGQQASTPIDINAWDQVDLHQTITEEDAAALEHSVTADEIVYGISTIDSDKAPGPDGFSSHFFKSCWRILGADFINAINSCFSSAKLLGEVNATLLTLIPKIPHASSLNEFRPIACCNVMYKCITKILTVRSKHIVKYLVSPCQSAFISGRSIQDNIMLAHELLRNYHRDNEIPLPSKVHQMVAMCITTPRFSIMVNGSAYGYIQGKRGIRQGCPLSTYLFVLLMELFNSLMLQQVQSGFYTLHPKCKDPTITHLCFADDLLVFMNEDIKSARSLATALCTFSARTGLVVNNNKSNIFLSSVDSVTEFGIKTVLGFEPGSLPVRYLGLPLLSTRLSHADCAPLVDHVITRIQSWKANTLSYVGRILLIKAVLSSMLVFWTACFVLPKKTIKALNTIFRNFLWACIDLTYKHPSVNWTIIFMSFKEGGLGIRCIATTNTTANLRHIWDIVSKKDTIWVNWVYKNLIKNKYFWYLKTPSDRSWCWRRILVHREAARQFILHLIGNGNGTKLWKDRWLPYDTLYNHFSPQLAYDSYHHIDATVSSCLTNVQWSLSPNISNDLTNFTEAMHEVKTDPLLEDRLVWTTSKNGEFSTIIWNILLRKLGLRGIRHTDLDQQIGWCVQNLKGNKDVGIIRKLTYNAFIYHIWWERNRRIFTQKSLTHELVYDKIIEEVEIKLFDTAIIMPDNPESRDLTNAWRCDTRFLTAAHMEVPWLKPAEDEVAVNTDGSMADSDAGYGSIIRDHNGTPLDAVAGSPTPLSITHHELQGVEAGFKLVVTKGHSKVSLRTDSMTVATYLLSYDPKPPWHCHHVWESIQRYRALLAEVTILHNYRETNRAADALASSKPSGVFIIIDPTNFDEKLKRIIEEDASGKLYKRIR
ncbi:uncharacterized protein LOC113306274 [Papaver somniferum]|uniref:uncharacterized protein LOC113306274 n=1 Tax=Papaver somniferum TaxID=3469 RepID=UPI000E6FAFF5|nr:uncharacterized protein LOC113306274 [Papaver somniferum]